jgi:hypothetical protein
MHNKALSVVAVCVNNPDRSPLGAELKPSPYVLSLADMENVAS